MQYNMKDHGDARRHTHNFSTAPIHQLQKYIAIDKKDESEQLPL